METTSRATAPGRAGGPSAPQRRADTGELTALAEAAQFPWYGLDEAFSGRRWVGQVRTGLDGTVEHGAMGHGEEPSLRFETNPAVQRFAVVVTVATRPVRASADGTGVLDATSGASAAWLAGSGLLSCTWPTHMERALRQAWLDQQTDIAWDLADNLGGEGWSTLSLPVDGVPADFHYRESDYGWVLAGTAGDSVHLGAYGRGLSAYGLGFSAVKDLTAYSG
ncbi:hypothetical protein [Streptomyces tardus]|uniref:hypothetical protein n=1 Tax=Streptomyces tardus TaxID=2780544 RepID=UPI003555F2A8